MKRGYGMGALAMAGILVMAGCAAPDAAQQADHTVQSEFSQELHDQLPQDIQDAGVVSVVGDVNPPWRASATDGEVSGLQVDLMREFSEILGVEFRNDMASGLPAVKLGVQSGRNDIGFGPLLSNEKTRQDMIFIDYTLGRMGFLHPSGGKTMTSVQDLCGSTVSYIAGTVIFSEAIKDFTDRCEQQGQESVQGLELPDMNAAILALDTQRADFAGMGAHQVAYTQAQNPEKYEFYLAAENEWPFDQLAMALNNEDEQLSRAVHGAWETVFANGVYEQLMADYNMEEIMVNKPVLHLNDQ